MNIVGFSLLGMKVIKKYYGGDIETENINYRRG